MTDSIECATRQIAFEAFTRNFARGLWMTPVGWAVVVADIVVMPSLAYVAAQYTYSLFGLDSLASGSHGVYH